MAIPAGLFGRRRSEEMYALGARYREITDAVLAGRWNWRDPVPFDDPRFMKMFNPAAAAQHADAITGQRLAEKLTRSLFNRLEDLSREVRELLP